MITYIITTITLAILTGLFGYFVGKTRHINYDDIGNLIVTEDDEGVYLFLELINHTPETVSKLKHGTITIRKNDKAFNGSK